MRARMAAAAARPICLAPGETPGTGRGGWPGTWLIAAARSPTTLISGWPGRLRSGSTFTRPARSHSAPVAAASMRPSGEAATPAAHTMHLLAMRRAVPSGPLISRPSPSMRVTIASTCTFTPRCSSCSLARWLSFSGMACSTRGPPSSSSTSASAGTMRRNSPASVWRAISASVPAISTPVGPPPITTKVSRARRRTGSLSSSASSKASSTRRRISKASASVFRPGASAAQASLPK